MNDHAGNRNGQQHPAAPGGPGRPGDALSAIETALVAAAKAPAKDTADPTVSLAFALGWQMAELFRPGLRQTARRDGELEGLGSLSDQQRRKISVAQVRAAVAQLTPTIEKADLKAPTDELDKVEAAVSNWSAEGSGAIESLHLALLALLTAADFRLGKAYGLGQALADTCRRKPGDATGVKEELDRYRVANPLAWLDELSTALPAHAAHSVYTSLETWRDWVAGQDQLPESTTGTLKRQGELWRSLLSGEKAGTEILEIGNYLEAADQVATRMDSVFWKTVGRFRWVSAIVLCLVIAGVVLLALGGGSKTVAGAGTLLAALGLSWKGVGGALGQLAGKLEQPLWGAVLDTAIADAITLLPENKPDQPKNKQDQPKNKHDQLGRAKLASELAAASQRALPAPNPSGDAPAGPGRG